MITKQQKKEIINDLTDKLSKQKVVIFSDYTGLTVNQAQELRSQLRENNIDYKVAKKTLIDLSLEKAGFKDIKIRNLSKVGKMICEDDKKKKRYCSSDGCHFWIFGSALAMIISYAKNASILWAILHGVLSWFYILYSAMKGAGWF